MLMPHDVLQKRRYGEAETHLKAALKIEKKRLGRRDPRIAERLSNLGNLYNKLVSSHIFVVTFAASVISAYAGKV